MFQWLVVHTQPTKEELACQNLLQQGFEVYLPRIQKIRRHARKQETVRAPLFPRYLFVKIDLHRQPWRVINSTRGVSCLLMHQERPSIIPTTLIEKLQAQEDPNGLVCLESLTLFKAGEKVLIKEGVFAGQSAIIQQLKDSERVQILLTFLGTENSMEFSIHDLENPS